LKVNENILDIVTPLAINFHKSYVDFGESVVRTLIITKYTNAVSAAWLSRISNLEGVVCSIHADPTDSLSLLENINKSMGEIGGKIATGGDALSIQRAEKQYEDAEMLLKKIDQEQENVFYVNVTIMIVAKDVEELEKRTKRVQSVVAGSKMKARVAMFSQEESLLSISPFAQNTKRVKEIGDRNMPVSTLAAAFPFNSSGINDLSGFVLGKENTGGIILLDIWKRGEDRTNSNWTILGLPGVGKSATIKHILLNEWSQGTKIIIIDPEREFQDLCANVQGQWVNCGGGKGGKINPLQVKDVPKDDDDDDGDEDSLFCDKGNGIGSLALHFQTLRSFFKLYLKSLDDIDMSMIEESLEELYKKHGIVWSTDTANIKREQYPVLKDLYELFVNYSLDKSLGEKKRERYDKLSLLLRSAAVGADASLWNGATTVTANSDFIVLDTHNLQEADDSIRRTQYFNVLTWAWEQLSKNREERVLLVVDEAYLLVDPDVPRSLQFLRNVSKRIRKYMGGLLVITHSVVDFLDPSVRRYGQALLDNPCFKFFMGTDGKNLEELSKLMNLTDAEEDMLAKKRRGHGLLIAGSKRLHVVVSISDFEFELFGKGGGN